MRKNNKIIPVFILHVLQLPDLWPKDGPQYYFRSGRVTQHPAEIFVACHKFFDGRKWAKTIISYRPMAGVMISRCLDSFLLLFHSYLDNYIYFTLFPENVILISDSCFLSLTHVDLMLTL